MIITLGLIKPSLFNPYLKQYATRGYISLLSLVLMVVASLFMHDKDQSIVPVPQNDYNQKEETVVENYRHEFKTISNEILWYEGGTLHDKSALDWQIATDENKMATCSDFVSTLWMSDDIESNMQSSITSIESMKPYVRELVICLDAATEIHPDSLLNHRMYTNQKVTSMATLCMALMEWFE